jgi:hypothetical protein
MPDLEDVPPASPTSVESQPTPEAPAVAASTGVVVLTSEQRMDIEHGVTRGLADPSLARFGSMTARLSQFTPRAYIVCGWIDPGTNQNGTGYEPFVAMFVPKTRTALLIGVGNSEEHSSAVRQRCIAEGVPLGA